MTKRTAYGAMIQVAQLIGALPPADFTTASTLNTTLDIQASELATLNENPRLRYLVMGIGAHSYREGVDGLAIPSTKAHTARDGGLFRMIALCVRDLDNDIDETNRARYVLRKIETIQGTPKVVYYGYRLTIDNPTIFATEQKYQNGRVVEENPFMPTAADRSPVAVDNSNVVTNPLSAEAIRISCPITISLDAFAVAEILNASMEVYGSEDYSHVSEMAVVTGVDRTIQSPNGQGGTVAFSEVIQAQIHSHIPAQLALKDRRSGLELRYDVASNEALYINTL